MLISHHKNNIKLLYIHSHYYNMTKFAVINNFYGSKTPINLIEEENNHPF
jgi:hypothetical protein